MSLHSPPSEDLDLNDPWFQRAAQVSWPPARRAPQGRLAIPMSALWVIALSLVLGAAVVALLVVLVAGVLVA